MINDTFITSDRIMKAYKMMSEMMNHYSTNYDGSSFVKYNF